jgi:signal transduction histidine kinase
MTPVPLASPSFFSVIQEAGGLDRPSAVLSYSRYRDMAAPLSRTLEAFGCRVRVEDAPSQFWQALQAANWDVVVYDVGIPEAPPLSFFGRILGSQPHAALWLLFDSAPQPALVSALGRDKRVRIFQRPVPPDVFLQALAEQARDAKGRTPQEARFLIVHPDGGICEMLAEVLAMEGHRARSVRNGEEAVQEAARQFYHAALVDTDIPDAHPWDLAVPLHQVNPHLEMIVLADYASLDTVLSAMRADVFDYLLKPLDMFAFRRVLHKALEKQKMASRIQSLLEGFQRANNDLFRLNELKSRFLRIVTHDLRTPLTSLKGFVQAFQAGLIPPDRAQASFRTMLKESEHLEHLINDLMDFAGMEAGKLRIDRVILDPAPVFRGVVRRFQEAARKKKIRYSIRGLPASLPLIKGDARRLDQALTNLIDNALKHTPAGGAVSVRVSMRKNNLEVRVKDTGVGIAPEHLPRVFEQFFQVESENRHGGLGLGLTIAREIVQRHDGEMSVESAGLGQGATFLLKLPLEGPGSGPAKQDPRR